MRNLVASDVTTDPQWVEEQTDRLIAWECLQAHIGGGSGEITKMALMDKLAVPSSYWYDMMGKIRRAYANATK